MRARIALALSLTLVAAADAAPSFDCARAKTASEKQICVPENHLQWFDRQMARLFTWANAQPNADQFTNVAEQRAFIKTRDACGSNVACIEQTYGARLRALAARIDAHEPFAEYSRDQSSVLWIARYGAEGAAKIFALGGNDHMCMFETDSAPIGGKGVVRFKATDNACRMNIIPDGDDMRIEAKNCQHYCGARAVMDGLYKKVP